MEVEAHAPCAQQGIVTDRHHQGVCVLLLQNLVQSCSRGGGEDSGGHVLRETTSRGLCGLVCPSRTGSSRLGIEPKTPGWLVQPNHQPIGGSDPNHQGIWSPPRAGQGM